MGKPILALGLAAVFTGLCLLARKRAAGCTGEIREYKFKLPVLAPIGFYLLTKIPYHFNSAYDRKVRSKIHELYGYHRVSLFYKIHLAQKIVLVGISLFLLALIALLGEVEGSFYVFGLLGTGLVYYWVDKGLEQKLKAKKREILIDLPGFINTLALLVNAGLPFSAAVSKIVREANPERSLSKEFNYLLADITAGKPISQAYEDLAQRCRVPEITRFVSTVLQNLSRGTSDLVYVLRILAQEAWEKRKEIAKKQGEEASAKLVFPMVMVFVAVAMIVLAPALMTMSR